MKLIMCKGLPASGKSTWAKEYVKKSGNTKRINKDDLRAMMDNGIFSGKNEKFVLEVRDFLIQQALMSGFNVIVDDTNLHPKHEARMREIIKSWDKVLMPGKKEKWEFEVEDFSLVPLETCIARDLKRPVSVGEKVIRQMYNQFLAPKPAMYIPKEGTPHAVMCDLDGTLALFGDKNPYDRNFLEDQINDPVASTLDRCEACGDKIILVSGRTDKHRKQTEKWLEDNMVKYHALFMRKEGDTRKDSIVKTEIFEKEIKDKYNVVFVMDDRNQVVDMWRLRGLTVFQVAEGDF